MSRRVRDHRLETREGRSKLKKRQNPYWRLINTNIHLGYRKGAKYGQWYYRVYLDGEYIKRAFAEADDTADNNGKNILNFDQAQEFARRECIKIINGSDWDHEPYTVEKAINHYLDDFKAHGKKSFYSTTTQINAHILPSLGLQNIETLTYEKLNQWKNTLAMTPRRKRTGLGTRQQYEANQIDDAERQRKRRASANRILTILKAILNHAFQNNRVSSNDPWLRLKPFKNVSAPKIRFLSNNEINQLLDACEADFKLLVKGALLTGARYGELTKLKVSDYFEQSVAIQQSKNGKARHVPLNDEGVKFFNTITRRRDPEEHIFIRTDGKQWGKNYQTRPLETACKKAQISPSISFHILRHTYGSALAMQGVPLQVISTVLGHSDTRVTQRHYSHLMPSYVADVIREKLPNFIQEYQN